MNISQVDESILRIPAVATVITVAWVTGADVYVKSLDSRYIEALNDTKTVMKKWYPQLSVTTKIIAESVSNSCPNDRYGLLFSGGLDSVTSYIKHRKKGLALIVVSGRGMLISDYKGKGWSPRFLQGDEVPQLIQTNVEDVVNYQLMHKECGLDWWKNLAHGIFYISVCAPLTCVKNIGSLFISSSFSRESNFPWGSHPLIDSKICWASTRVGHDCFELSRQEKIRFLLKEYIIETGKFPILRICADYQVLESNCQKCEKCYFTIVGLLLEGIDPNKCGFNINSDTLTVIKEALVDGRFFRRETFAEKEIKILNRINSAFDWKDIQNAIPETIENDLYGSKEFFEWFRGFDIMKSTKQIEMNQVPRLFLRSFFTVLPPVTSLLPKRIQKIVHQIFSRLFVK